MRSNWISAAASGLKRRGPRRQGGHGLGLGLVHLDVVLQGVYEVFLEILGGLRRIRDLAQSDDRIFVVISVYGNLRPGGDHAGPVACNQNEVEPIFYLIDTIFNRDACHSEILVLQLLLALAVHT